MKSRSIIVSFIISGILSTTGCNKDEEKKATFPILDTKTPTTITSNSAVVGGSISSDGGAIITERGVCYSFINQNPTVRDFVITEGNGTGNYLCTLPDLDPETTYYARAYALNSAGIGYGNPVSFTSEAATLAPIAAFTAAPASGTRPLSVSFTDQSTNNPGSWHWDFGDGGTSTQQNPDHTFIQIGNYTVWLTVTNISGTDIEKKNSLINVTGSIGTMTDIDGNVYKTIEIGTQTWMAENLKVLHYSNGDAIANVIENTQWDGLTTGAYCWFNNDIILKDSYGALYNWYAVVDSRELCPSGWHTPSEAEWDILIDYLGDLKYAGGKMKSTRKAPDANPRWDSPNTGATNESGFSGLPGGARNSSGSFFDLGTVGYFWNSTNESFSDHVRYCSLNYLDSAIYKRETYKQFGFSVRCLKD